MHLVSEEDIQKSEKRLSTSPVIFVRNPGTDILRVNGCLLQFIRELSQIIDSALLGVSFLRSVRSLLKGYSMCMMNRSAMVSRTSTVTHSRGGAITWLLESPHLPTYLKTNRFSSLRPYRVSTGPLLAPSRTHVHVQRSTTESFAVPAPVSLSGIQTSLVRLGCVWEHSHFLLRPAHLNGCLAERSKAHGSGPCPATGVSSNLTALNLFLFVLFHATDKHKLEHSPPDRRATASL